MFRKTLKVNIWLLVACFGVIFLMGSYFYRQGGFDQLRTWFSSSASVSDADFTTTPLTVLKITISDSSLDVLRGDREVAMRINHLFEENRHQVPGIIYTENGESKVKLRLKGDRPDHWEHPTHWSFRMNVKGGTFHGMKKFNVQRPIVRGHLDEWLFHQLLKRNGLIYLRYQFVEFYVNDEHRGVYAIEEQFDKRLIENNDLREGPIFKFNTSLYWHGKLGYGTYIEGAPLEPYNIGKKNAETNPLYAKFLLAVNLIEGYRNGDIEASKVFDVSKLAKVMAIVDMTGYHHASSLDNLRFYFNPATSLIEPIGYDNSQIHKLSEEYLLGYGRLLGERMFVSNDHSMIDHQQARSWYQKLFADPTFFNEYIKAVEKVSAEIEMAEWLQEIDSEFQNLKFQLEKQDRNYQCKSVEILKYNAQYMRDMIKPFEPLQVYVSQQHEGGNDTISLIFKNLHSFPMNISSIVYKDSITLYPVGESIVQAAGARGQFISKTELKFIADTSMKLGRKLYKKLAVNYSIVGSESTMSTGVFPWKDYDFSSIKDVAEIREGNVENFPFLEIDRAHGFVVAKQGEWLVEQTIVVPKEFHLRIEEGTVIKLANNASIVCYNAVDFAGTNDKPIVIYSDSVLNGQGVLVIGAEEQSTISHTLFSGLSRFKVQDWELPGAVNFYESPVEINHTTFKGNREGDDYLNIVRSEFKMVESEFVDVNADAFDGDFVVGLISSVNFTSVGNDGIDFSGSNIKVYNCTFDSIGDKAISGGERSYIDCRNTTIKNSELAITSKDNSTVDVSETVITDCRVAFAVFMKKSEFGGALLNVRSTATNNVEVQYLVEKGSQLVMDKVDISPNHDDVKSVLYGKDYGKSSH